MKTLKIAIAAAFTASALTTVAEARDEIQIAGSSTVLPYASIVAEAFGENFEYPTPVVGSGGSGAGRKKLCEGVGENTIDIANSSSRIKQSDIDLCASNSVTEIQEVRIGYDGIVFASDINGESFEFTPVDWYKALSDKLVIDGNVVDNPNKTWADVDGKFPAQDILAFVPGTKHGTREVFEDKVILAGCEETGDFDVFLAAAEGRLTTRPRRKPPRRLVSRCAPTACRSTSTATTPRRWLASTPTRTASACSVCPSTRTTPTSFRSPR